MDNLESFDTILNFIKSYTNKNGMETNSYALF